MDLLNKDRPLLFSLPNYSISKEDQRMIIDYAYTHTKEWNGQVQFYGENKDDLKKTDYFGRVQLRRLTNDSIEKISQGQELDFNWLSWAARLDPNLEWEWMDTPITETVKRVLEPMLHLYTKLNRVLILVQKPGSAIPMHIDRVIKNDYDQEGYFVPGPSADLPIHGENYHWSVNKYLALKFPLSELDGANGLPTVEFDGKQYCYDVGNNLFAINEIDILHGAGAVDYRRGVIFLDGLLDYDKLLKETWTPVGLNELY